MLPEVLEQRVRTACGDMLVLDAKRARALVTDAARVADVCKRLRAAGFARFIDFSAQHLEGERFSLTLLLRCPEFGHSRLSVKWNYRAISVQESALSLTALGEPPVSNGQNLPQRAGGNGHLAEGESANGAGDKPLAREQFTAHPGLSSIWPAALSCEREIFELFGIVFAGSDNITPLLLDEQFQGFPMRRDYKVAARKDYAAGLLEARHFAALLEQGP